MDVREYLSYLSCELNRSDRTVGSYADDLFSFEKYFQSLDDGLTWESIDRDIVRGWLESMVDQGNSPATVAQRLSALKGFYKFALSRGMVAEDPVHGLKGPKRDKLLPQFLKESEMDKLLDSELWQNDFVGTRNRLILMILYETGVRLSELVGIDDDAVDLGGRKLKVTGKGNKQRIVPFGEELKNAFSVYQMLRDNEVDCKDKALLVSSRGIRLSPASIRKLVGDNLTRVCTLKKKSPHVLRHTFATAMLNHGADIESLKQLLGHSRLTTTEIYTHTTFEQLKSVYTKAHPRA